MSDSTYTPRHAAAEPKHKRPYLGTRRARREAELAERDSSVAARSLIGKHAALPNHKAVMLELRISDLNKAKDYIDGEIEMLQRELSLAGRDSK